MPKNRPAGPPAPPKAGQGVLRTTFGQARIVWFKQTKQIENFTLK
jgi:hypothetical protein